MDHIHRLRDDYGRLPSYSWPGGYQITYICHDGNTVCPTCANLEADAHQKVTDCFIHWEGSPICCDDCGATIESEYGDPEAE